MNECDLNEDIHQYPIRQAESEIVVNTSIKRNIIKMSSYTESSNAPPEFFKKYFNKIYCINLSKKIHKWDSTDLRLRQKNIEATRFDAIDGDLFRGMSELSTGEMGCLCSHLEVIKHAKLNNYSRILIFEDDVHLSKDFEERILSIKDFSWKLLYLGGSQYSWKNIDTSKDFYLSHDTFGTFAYAVDGSMFDELIEAFSAKNEQVDKILTGIQKKHYGECYTMYPNIAIADVRTSGIRNGRDIYSHSKKMKWNLSMFSAFDKSTKKVLLLPDARGWAFDNIAKAIVKYNPFPEKVYYEIVYTRDIHLERNSIDTDEWDYVYIMFEGETLIPPAKNIIRGCYSAFWLENRSFTPEYMSEYFSKCGGAIFANSGLRDRFIKNLPEKFPTRVIHDASDENLFYPIKHRKNKDFTVLFVGNTRRKIKNFGTIEKICQEAGVTLKICSNVPNTEMVHEYNKADVIINYSDFEGGPQTFVEAALCEVPMLIRDTNQLAKLIPCFIGKDEEEFVKILTQLKKNRHECIKKGEEAYGVVIKNFTYVKTAKKFTEFFLSFDKKDLTEQLTVFVVNAGENPNYDDCIKSVYDQTCSFQLKFIENISPMSKAFQKMIDECETPYYVQVDGDMILNSDAIETIYNKLVTSDKNISIVTYMLKDVHLDFDIYGIKGYKHDILKNYPYNLEIISCEMEQVKRMDSDGYKIEMIEETMGYHSPKWTPELIYERYFDLMEKWKVYNYYWMRNLPGKLLDIFKKNPTDINFYALAGAMHSISSTQPIRNREKDFSIKNENIDIIKTMCLSSTSLE